MSNQTKTKPSFLCIELLESFSKKELQKFHQFIISPYFNTDVKLIRLYELIHKEVLHKEFTEELQSKVYMKAFDEKTGKILIVNEKKVFRTKLSQLNLLAQQFLVIENLQEKKNFFNDLLFSCLLDKRQFNTFQVLFKREDKRLAIKKRKESLDFEYIYKMRMHQLDHLFLSDMIYKKSKYDFGDVLFKLDVQYLIKKLTLLTNVLSDGFLETEYDTCKSAILALKPLMEASIIKREQPNIIVLWSAINFLQEPNRYSYQKLLNILNQNQNQIPIDELKGLYLIVTNFFSREIRKGNLSFEKDFTELYFLLDDQNLLLTQKTMPSIKLKNIVVRMCKSSDFDKAQYFIEKYTPYIMKEDQKSIKNLCLAYISFYQQKYEKALDYTLDVESINVTIESNHRLIMMKIYYELDKVYSEKTERFYRSAEKFFSDSKLLSSENKKGYKNFTQILINLYRFKHNEGRMTIEKLETKLKQQEYNTDKKWQLEKIQELKKLNILS